MANLEQREKYNAYRRGRYAEDRGLRERARQRAAKYREENPEKVAEQRASYYEGNAARYKVHANNRKAARLQRTPKWANLKKIERVYQLASWASKFTDEPLEVDHIIPLQGEMVSGLHVENNLQIITRSENRRKKNKWPI